MKEDLSNKDFMVIELTSNNIARFLIPSLLGVFLFLLPVPSEGAITTPIGIMSEWLAAQTKSFSSLLITIVILTSAIISTLTTIFKPKFILENSLLSKLFKTSNFI